MITQTRAISQTFYRFPCAEEAAAFITFLDETAVSFPGGEVTQTNCLQVIASTGELRYWECKDPTILTIVRLLTVATKENEKELLNRFLIALSDADYNGREVPQWVLSAVSRGAGCMIPLEII